MYFGVVWGKDTKFVDSSKGWSCNINVEDANNEEVDDVASDNVNELVVVLVAVELLYPYFLNHQ